MDKRPELTDAEEPDAEVAIPPPVTELPPADWPAGGYAGRFRWRGSRADSSGTGRIEALSDGVFAFAITLLVLEIRVPRPSTDGGQAVGGLLQALLEQWPSYLGYVISFVTIGIIWANHYVIYRYIRHADRFFLMLNVLFLMCIAFLPFPTSLLAGYLTDPAEQVTVAAIYGSTLTVTAVVYNMLWWYAASNRRLLGSHVDPEAVRIITKRFLVGPVLYLTSVGLVFINIGASLAIHGLLLFLYVLPERSERDVVPHLGSKQ